RARTSMPNARSSGHGSQPDRQATNEELTVTNNSLILSDEQFRTLFYSDSTANIVISDTGTIELYNGAAEKIFGYLANEAVGQNIRLLMPGPDKTRHDRYPRDFFEGGIKKAIGMGREVTGRRRNGEEFSMRLGVGEILVGNKKSFIGSITDLTEVKGLEAQARRSQRLEAVGQLAGGIAHDFNNLLAVISGNADMLSRKTAGNEDAQPEINAISRAVERGASLTRRLLSFSREQELDSTSTDLPALISSLEDMLRRTLGETTELTLVHGANLWDATVDAHAFENALLNLSINARDAMPAGGELTIRTANVTFNEADVKRHKELQPGDYVEVTVIDTGIGIPADALEKVFEPFFTTKNVGKGSGLGLSMVYGFVKQSNGSITVASKLGQGTAVSLYLPRAREVANQKLADDRPESVPRGTERILVVEDDPDLREIVVAMLSDEGYEIVTASRGDAAIELLKGGHTFDLLFSDIVLPGSMNGLEIAEEAKRLQPGIRLLFTSGYADTTISRKAQNDPKMTLLGKPYQRAVLLKKVREILDSGTEQFVDGAI
ncbi:MAG: ATP-binding protein, partial [Proteobacteria bacterium]|nr:ATP-binding protein [Pseudomonadota bacterium]